MDKNTLLSSFGKWVAPINFNLLYEQVDALKLDYYTKKLTTESYLKLMLLAHLDEWDSLHDMSDAMVDDDLQKAVGFESISVSQLSRRNNEIPSEVLAKLFFHLVGKIKTFHTGTKTSMPLNIIDSTTIPLNVKKYRWAEFRKTKAGLKIHMRLVMMDKHTLYPDQLTMTPAKEHDRNQLEVLVDDPNAMYVFDRGYLDYERFDRMTDDGYFFVSRLKKNAVTRDIHIFHAREEDILSDKMVWIGTTQNRAENAFRVVEVKDRRGEILRLITNRFDISPKEVSDIYRSRWEIELFFKWLKQHVKIKRFYGESETAVENQVYTALIVYCLHVLIQLETGSKRKILQVSRWLKRMVWKPAYQWVRRLEDRTVP
ncbi:IS4 family transposase [Pueribacillus sp. YX66]|uniref:IS4 family transposase n=1 Tax=Pueribacillus sp. YX66 TaxID=3229242 RepID=UPI00358D9EC0